MYIKFIKRSLDVFISLLLLAILLPFILGISALLFFFQDRAVFFFQDRPGKNKKIFKIVKFKTMNDNKDKNGKLLPDEQRLTKIGKFIRSTSLDELPQLFSVLKGDMSLVGPRPLLVKYLDRYTPEQARRHEVRPGITGWAQVNGRNAISWEERFRLDVYYVDNYSLALDLKIIRLTLRKVIKREGISAAGNATMTEFLGTHQQHH